MRFIIIRDFKDSKMLINIIRNLLGVNIRIKEESNYIIINHNYKNDDDIIRVLNSLSEDLMDSFISYISSDSDEMKMNEELDVILPIFLENDFPTKVYNFKSLLLEKPVINNKRRVLNYILESTGVDEEFIKGFALNDLNVSKASKAMYIHRNTMIYKLDKLNETSGFDLRSFIDMYILFNLIN